MPNSSPTPRRKVPRPVMDFFTDADLVSTYTREEALADGVLVDVSGMARQAGFTHPVAVTAAVWADITDIPRDRQHQDADGRLWDVLSVARYAIQGSKEDATVLVYNLIMQTGTSLNYTVKLVCGPGDAGEPVMTLMRPNED